jgi:NAD(P)-dependent dehydrogenase (short-subunit alcohol dehydrogenase family)
MNLEGKVALITGAGSGIGQAAALKLAKAGARIGALDHTIENAEKTVRRITSGGGQAIALEADISDPAAMEAAVQRIRDKWGRLDVMLANAASTASGPPLRS